MTGGSAAVTKVGAIVIACLLILYGGTAYVAPLAAASSPKPTATAPEQLVHAFPLGPQRLCCTKGSRVHPTAGSPTTRSRSVGHPGGAKTHPGSSSAIWIVVLGVGVLLLLATAEAIHKTRRRAPVRAPGAGNGRAWGSAETARSASTAPNEWSEGGRASNLRFWFTDVAIRRAPERLRRWSLPRRGTGAPTKPATPWVLSTLACCYSNDGTWRAREPLMNGQNAAATPTQHSTSECCSTTPVTSMALKPPGGGAFTTGIRTQRQTYAFYSNNAAIRRAPEQLRGWSLPSRGTGAADEAGDAGGAQPWRASPAATGPGGRTIRI